MEENLIKMVEKTTIGLSAIAAILLSLGISIVPGMLDNKTGYYCESRPELGIAFCDSFTKYVASNGKCIRNDNTNLICADGWKEIVDDTILPDETEDTVAISNKKVWGDSYIIKEGKEPMKVN